MSSRIQSLVYEYYNLYYTINPYDKIRKIKKKKDSPTFNQFIQTKGFKPLKVRMLMYNSFRITKKFTISLRDRYCNDPIADILEEDAFETHNDWYWFKLSLNNIRVNPEKEVYDFDLMIKRSRKEGEHPIYCPIKINVLNGAILNQTRREL